MEKLLNQKRRMKPLFSTIPLVAETSHTPYSLISLFFSTETQRTQSYTERHCERSEAIQRFLTARDAKIFPQRTQGINDVIAGNDPQSPVQRFVLGDSCFRRNDGVTLCVLCAFFANLAVKKPNSINQLIKIHN